MNTRSTFVLFLLALGLSAYVFFIDRRAGRTIPTASGALARFPTLEVTGFSSVELLRSNSVLRAERTNEGWVLRLPAPYPAQTASIERLLGQVAKLVPSSYVSAQEVGAQPDALRAFGLDPPLATLTLTGHDHPVILRLGGAVPGGGRIYLQLVGTEGVFVADSALLEALPASPDDWRDRVLLDLGSQPFDRLSLAAGGRTVFEAVKDPTGRWQLRQPLSARADGERIEGLVAQLQTVRVSGFVTDAPVVDRASLGLQPPATELSIGRGTNELARLEVGGVVTNSPTLRSVRRLAQTKVVLVEDSALESLSRPLSEFRDPRLVGPVEGVTRIERRGARGFVVELTGTNWWVTAPRRFPAHTGTVDLFLDQISVLEIAQFVNDVVSDLQLYGLIPPSTEFVLGHGTNTLVHVQLGGFANTNRTLLYARRLDEPGVYAVPPTVLVNLETAGQLRDWRFTSTNVSAVDIVQQGRARKLVRTAAGWQVAAGAPGALIPDAIEETLHRLGEWDSVRYAITDEPAMLKRGRFGETAHELTLTLAEGSPVRTLRLRFGGRLANQRLVLANFDDDPVPLRLELSWALYDEVARVFAAP